MARRKPILMKAGDTAPAVQATLLDAAGAAVDLTGASVRFLVATKTEPRTTVVDAAADIAQVGDGSDGSKGTVVYVWAPGDTDAAGSYDVEFEVTFADSTVQTFPTQGYIDATFADDLGGLR